MLNIKEKALKFQKDQFSFMVRKEKFSKKKRKVSFEYFIKIQGVCVYKSENYNKVLFFNFYTQHI